MIYWRIRPPMAFPTSTLMRPLLVLLLFSPVIVLPANAQESAPARSTLEKGKWSLALELPDGGGSSLGLWRMMGERTNLGLQLGFNWADHEQTRDDPSYSLLDQDSWNVNLAPVIQRYLALAENVAPFLLGGIEFGVGESRRLSETGDDTRGELERHYDLGARLGVGVDWFPLSSISIGGHTGIRLRYRHFEREGTGPETSGRSVSLNTFVSAILLRIYF